MITVSLSMIVRNEEDTIGRCLESVKDLVDEIIIVDTGSTDKTKEVVRQYTDCILDFQWIDDFAAARNFAFEHAKMDYIFWLDADDVLMEVDRKKFLTLKKTLDPGIDSVKMHYHLDLDSNGHVISSLRRNRLVKRENHFKWYGAVHEYLEVSGTILYSEVAVTHCSQKQDTERNLRIYENRLLLGEEFSPRDLYYYANELFNHQEYNRAIEYYKKFLETKKGWMEDNISACGNLADCYHFLGDQDCESQYILKSFEYDTPRAELCCRLGYLFLEKNQLLQAIYWYKLATQLEKPVHNGRINHACWSWLPHLMLCHCYTLIDNIELACEHNEAALQYHPHHPNMLRNKKKLESLLEQRQLAIQMEKWLPIALLVDENFQLTTGTEKLRITFVMDHMNICGGVKSVIEYTNLLVKRGHQVYIVCHDPKPNWMEVIAHYIQVPAGTKIVHGIPETDVTITTFWKQLADCYKAQKGPLIHFEQGDTYIFEFEKYNQDVQNVWQYHWSVPVPIITVSNALASLVEKYFQRKPQILHNALNEKVFFPRNPNQPKSDRPKVMFVGPEQWTFKGISDILAAVQLVRENGRDIEPIWVTQIPPNSAFDGTLMIGPPQDELGELYRTADLYVCGSHYESFGLPPLEAMACGCAVISTCNVGVLEYAEHGKNCLITSISSPINLANAIIELLDDKDKRASLVKEGYQTAKKLRMDLVIERLEYFLYGVVRDWNRLTEGNI